MALHDPVITLNDVNATLPGRFTVSFRLVVPDDTEGYDGIDQTFSVEYRQGVALTKYIDLLDQMMQDAIDKYISEKAIKTAPALTTFISTLTGMLEV